MREPRRSSDRVTRVVKRRDLLRGAAGAGLGGIGLLSGCALYPARRQPLGTMPLIGYLGIRAAADPANVRDLEGFRQGLHEQGLVEGRNLTIEQRWAEGRGRPWAREQTAELVALGARVIVAGGSSWRGAREMTDSVPIVMTGGNAEHAIARGWAASAARPGGTVTGLAVVPQQAFRKRLEVLMAVAPQVRRLAVMSDLESHVVSEADMRATAEGLGLQALVLDVRTAGELELALDRARTWGADAISGEGLITTNLSTPLAVAALKDRLPTTFFNGRGVEAGILLFYGAVFADGYASRRAAWYVARIIGGTGPGDLPIEVADQVRFFLNRKTLAALGLSLPSDIAVQVTDWIE